MTSAIVVTADPAITVAQDTPAITVIVPVTQFPLNKSGFSLSVELAASTNFNTELTAGFYNTIDTLSVNAPISGHMWYLQVDADGDNPTTYIRQTATILDSTAATYFRTMVNGSWGTWQPIVTLDISGRLPPVDGSQLTNISAGVSTKILNFISGLTLSTAGGSGTFGVAAGAANDSTNTETMVLLSAMTKTTNSWSVGTGNGAIDNGSIAANTWYHVYLIYNAATIIVDVIFSLSATSPSLPVGYTLFRRIGSMFTSGSSFWGAFIQVGDIFTLGTPSEDVNVANPGTSAVLRTITTPLGISTEAILSVADTPLSTNHFQLISSPLVSDQTPGISAFTLDCNAVGATSITFSGQVRVITNTSSQIRTRQSSSGASDNMVIVTTGWIDTRGRT